MKHGWTTDKEILAEAEPILDRFFWDVFPATYANRIEVPTTKGLYMFSSIVKVNNADGIHIFRNPFYIGESEDLTIKKRFEKHTRRPEWRKMQKVYGRNFTFSYAEIDKDLHYKIVDWEDILIRAFGPIQNQKYSRRRPAIESV